MFNSKRVKKIWSVIVVITSLAIVLTPFLSPIIR